MSYLIRSANGQRSLTKINSNKTQDQQDRMSIREDIIEALKGIVIKFELRIADIIEESTDVQDDDEKQKPDTIKATFDVKRDNIISDLKTKLVINDQQVPEQQAEVVAVPAAATVSQENGIEKENIIASFKPAVLDLPEPPSVANMQILKRVSDIRPIVSKPGPAALDPPRPPSVANLQIPEPVNDIKPLESKPEPVVRASEPAAVSEPPKPAPPKTTELVKGTLAVGSVIETCVVGFAGSDEEPIYYIPYDTDKFIRINQLILDQGLTIESQPLVNSINVGDVVLGKSKEDNTWYRSVVKKVNVEGVEVFFFDWGLEETLEIPRIRLLAVPELELSSVPAAAVKIDVINKPGPLVNRFVRDQERLNVKVESYDKTTDTYSINIEDDQ